MKSPVSPARTGFALGEAVALTAAVSMLATLAVPTWTTRSKNRHQSLACQANGRQLALAWNLYAGDNRGEVPGAGGFSSNIRPAWCAGSIDFFSPSSTNPAPLLQGPLHRYTGGSLTIYRCPADRSATGSLPKLPFAGPRIRSVSMNDAFGDGAWLQPSAWRTFRRLSDVPNPAQIWVFMDEHPDSINDGILAVACDGADKRSTARVVDFPSPLHNGGATIAYADGRAETHEWSGPTLRLAPAKYSGVIALNVPAADAWVDILWLRDRTSIPR